MRDIISHREGRRWTGTAMVDKWRERMIMRYIPWAGVVACGILAATAVGMAATEASASGPTSRTNDTSAYVPVTSDLMNAVIQPRHTKLWLAGKSQNWAFADYERHNLGGALARMAAAIPSYKGTSNSHLIAPFP